MEIPFVVNARKDTGLFNSKVGIWLFLASEVTLFGGLFSGYLFLRLYADYPWPERALPVLPGLINTFVLIGSSVTVVFAWAALKMREWKKFQLYMSITLACAAIFMVLKGVEYSAKFGHQGVQIAGDGPVQGREIVEGHVHYAKVGEDGLIEEVKKENKDDEGVFLANKVLFKVSELSFVLKRPTHEAYVDSILEQAAAAESKITLTEAYRVIDPDQLMEGKMSREQLLKGDEAVVVDAGEELSIDALDKMEDAFLDARSYDQKLSTKFLAASWDWVREQPGYSEKEMQGTYVVTEEIWTDRRKEDADKLKQLTLQAPLSVSFKVDPPFTLVLGPNDLVKYDKESGQLRDDTTMAGELLPSPIIMGVDALDFRTTAQRAEAEGLDPLPVIEGTWLLTHKPVHHHGDAGEKGEGGDDRNTFKKIWDCHMAWLKTEEKRLAEKDREPTDNDRYRVNWDQIIAYKELDYDAAKVEEYCADRDDDKELYSSGLFDLKGFAGANHSKFDFPHLEIPRERVNFESTFTPKWNTYYAIYFTITGLHGLHVIGGAIVLGYYLFFGRKMYESNPEWLANRVEIGGLFWHFVDLVWIFLFPILYLM
ncbi:MAG: cytochrome c oxidase subunit 3 [Akkermansiaceae bacterium]|jgi:heme/copper-type cytochrome/quinol oxidase subunit 3